MSRYESEKNKNGNMSVAVKLFLKKKGCNKKVSAERYSEIVFRIPLKLRLVGIFSGFSSESKISKIVPCA